MKKYAEDVKKIIILTNTNSIKGRSIIKLFQNSNIEIEKVISINTNFGYYFKLFKFVCKRVGIVQTIIFSILKLSTDLIHELFFCNLSNLNSLLNEYNIPFVNIKSGKEWQRKANKIIDNCNSKIIVIGQVGILGEEFNLKRNDRLILNSHPGKLPEYRGIDSFKWTILNRDWESLSTTIHIVRNKIDGGEIINVSRYDWRKLNWIFVDRELMIMSGKHLVKYLTSLESKNLIESFLKSSVPQKREFKLYYKMGILKELKSLCIFTINNYF